MSYPGHRLFHRSFNRVVPDRQSHSNFKAHSSKATSGAALPSLTQILIELSATSIRAYFILGHRRALWADSSGFAKFKQTKRGIPFGDRVKLRECPCLGNWSTRSRSHGLRGTFAALLRERCADFETLRIVGQSAGNTVVELAAEKIAASIERGDNLAVALGQHAIFPPMLVSGMVSAGEQTGKVDVMLEKISDFWRMKRLKPRCRG